MPGLRNIRFHIAEPETEIRSVDSSRSAAPGGHEADRKFPTDEDAARHHLVELITRAIPAMRAVTTRSGANDFPCVAVEETPHPEKRRIGTTLVKFTQNFAGTPIFGSSAIVELDDERRRRSINADVADAPIPVISPKFTKDQALLELAKQLSAPINILRDSAQKSEQYYYFSKKTNGWHLAYLFRDIPALPLADIKMIKSSHLGRSPRLDNPEMNYLVSAITGDILLSFSSGHTVVKCEGFDDLGSRCSFYGSLDQKTFILVDPFRRIKTSDHQFNDIDSTFTPKPVTSSSYIFPNSAGAAVSAHINARHVCRFYNEVLGRIGGIDGHGKLELESIVNCTYSRHEHPPEWRNAVWWKQKMWYGQVKDGNGYRSFSRYLDIIAHELTHGVTEHSSNLIYQGQSGALNESFSDIFAIFIKNWSLAGFTALPDWNWEIGSGLGDNGGPLRDVRCPGRTSDPEHMKDYREIDYDCGGVHIYSNIHNKAAYNVITAIDDQGRAVFSPEDAALMYYICLLRLTPQANFASALLQLIDATRSLYYEHPDLPARVEAIKRAYGEVGIE